MGAAKLICFPVFLPVACCLVMAWLSQLTRCCLSFSIPYGWCVGGKLDFEHQVVDFSVLNIIPASASFCFREWEMIK